MTIIELLVASALIIVMLSIGYSLYLMGISGFIDNANALDEQSNVRIAIDHISRSFRRANTIRVEGESLIVGLDTYYLEGDVLRINLNQLATGISEFSVSQPLPHQVHIRIASLPNAQGESFELETWLTIRRL